MNRLIPLVALAVVAGGCGTIEKTGALGETVEARDLHVTLEGVRTLSEDGRRWLGADVNLCNDAEAAVGAYDFTLRHSGGVSEPAYTSGVFGSSLRSVRDGCVRGWLTFGVPEGAEAETLRLDYTRTGSSRRASRGYTVDFQWDVRA